ncbi:MAG: polyprenyl synthetase family protein, partial [Sphingomonadaceae bacterium]
MNVTPIRDPAEPSLQPMLALTADDMHAGTGVILDRMQ